MRQRFEQLDAEIGSTTEERTCEVTPFAIDSGAPPHVEDAFLAEFAGFAAAHDHAAHAALELARAALDMVEDIDGCWQSLRVEAWLAGAWAARAAIDEAELVRLARAFVDWLVECGHLSLHGQRLLARRIARYQRRVAIAA